MDYRYSCHDWKLEFWIMIFPLSSAFSVSRDKQPFLFIVHSCILRSEAQKVTHAGKKKPYLSNNGLHWDVVVLTGWLLHTITITCVSVYVLFFLVPILLPMIPVPPLAISVTAVAVSVATVTVSVAAVTVTVSVTTSVSVSTARVFVSVSSALPGPWMTAGPISAPWPTAWPVLSAKTKNKAFLHQYPYGTVKTNLEDKRLRDSEDQKKKGTVCGLDGSEDKSRDHAQPMDWTNGHWRQI